VSPHRPDTAATRNERESTFQRAKPIALGLILAVFAVIGLRILAELREVLVLVFIAVLFASAISRPADALERRGVPRGAAIAIVQLVVTAVIVAVFWVVVPPLVSQLALFSEQLPSYVTRFQHLQHEYASVKRQYPGCVFVTLTRWQFFLRPAEVVLVVRFLHPAALTFRFALSAIGHF